MPTKIELEQEIKRLQEEVIKFRQVIADQDAALQEAHDLIVRYHQAICNIDARYREAKTSPSIDTLKRNLLIHIRSMDKKVPEWCEKAVQNGNVGIQAIALTFYAQGIADQISGGVVQTAGEMIEIGRKIIDDKNLPPFDSPPSDSDIPS